MRAPFDAVFSIGLMRRATEYRWADRPAALFERQALGFIGTGGY
jgi:hypothetical protein